MSPKKEFLPYALLFAGTFVLLSLLSFQPEDTSGEANWFGKLGYYFAYGVSYFLGYSSYLAGVAALVLGVVLFRKPDLNLESRLLKIPILILSTSLALDLLVGSSPTTGESTGGLIGSFLGEILDFIVGGSGKAIFTAFLFTYSVIGIFESISEKLLLSWILELPNRFSNIKKSPQNKAKVAKTTNWKEILIQKKLEWDALRISRLRPSQMEPVNSKGGFDFEKSKKATEHRKIYPRYQNSSLYEGIFTDREIFHFHNAPVRLKRKFQETPDARSLGFTILDFRNPKKQISKEMEEESPKFEEDTSISNSLDIEGSIEEYPKQDQEKEENRDSEMLIEEESEVLEEKEIPTRDFQIMRSEANLPHTYIPPVSFSKGGYYISPKLLGQPKAKPLNPESKEEIERIARKIEEIISHYGIESKVISMERGPIITRYELTIPNGIKLNRITSLDSELKLYLAVKSIRIVAPIPGKSSIGIEVPNKNREDVYLMDILRESSLTKSMGGLSICIGKDIAGRPVYIDISKLPHLLVAGTTGSGKSVSLNSMVTSLIFTRSPSELRFIMIDPKMVEMLLYEDIPHLLMPVIVDPKKATKALSWAIQEMEARYQTISRLKCRDFASYNRKVEEWAHKEGYEKMPYIVIMIDELSDLMMVSGKELEEQIQRISQKSRAVGIHLVMATQRPSVDVITGLIKANCPARIAFQVAQKTDSRTILDTNGAETLLGKGDFLYRSPTSSDLIRIQAPFVSEEEIERIVAESRKQAHPGFVEINWEDESGAELQDSFEEDEALIEDAWRVICQTGKASGSMIQRHLRIGYNKAARIIEILEKRGVVSPQIGTKPREILKSI